MTKNLPFVYVLDAGRRLRQARGDLGTRVGNDYVIPHGLNRGDKVVVDGSIFLHFIDTQ